MTAARAPALRKLPYDQAQIILSIYHEDGLHPLAVRGVAGLINGGWVRLEADDTGPWVVLTQRARDILERSWRMR